MAKDRAQPYLSKLDFIIERRRVFDVTPYDKPFNKWTRQEKTQLTQEFNRARIANSTDELAEQKDYAEMARVLRPFSKEFTPAKGYTLKDIHKLAPAKKAKLTKYYKKAVELASKQFELYHTNDKPAMKAMRKLANQDGYPGFNQVFFPAPPGTKIHYNKKTKTATARGLRSAVTSYYWEQFGVTPEDIAADPVGVVKAVIAQTGNGERRFAIKAGEYNIGKGVPLLYTPNAAAKKVAQLVEKYGKDSEDPNDPNSSYFGNWLTGIEGWDFETRQDEQRFIRATKEESTERVRYKRAYRKRLQRKRGKR